MPAGWRQFDTRRFVSSPVACRRRSMLGDTNFRPRRSPPVQRAEPPPDLGTMRIAPACSIAQCRLSLLRAVGRVINQPEILLGL